MQFYARFSWRMIRQVVGDLFVLAWVAAWWLVGRAVDGAIRMVAEPARRTEQLAGDLRQQTVAAAEQAGKVPVVGEQLRRPFDEMATTIATLAESAGQQVGQIEFVATLVGWLIFLIPAMLLVLVWLPRRIAFTIRAGRVRALADTEAGRDLLALRALATQPLDRLTLAADDPIAAWRAGDQEVTERLAELELRSAGVSRSRP